MRSKPLLLGGIALAGAVALFSATQVWVSLGLAPGAAAFDRLDVTGQQLNASLSPVALATLAAALALTIAGRWLRYALGALVALLGAGIVAIAVGVLRDPGAAATGRLAEATGLAGSSQADLVISTDATPLIAVALAAGAVLALLGALVLLLGGRWKTAGRKYRAAGDTGSSRPTESRRSARRDGETDGGGDGDRDRIADWDELSDGSDPTADPTEDR